MDCRHCKTPLTLTFVDLGSAPPSNAYLTETALRKPEIWLPLRVLVCSECWLVQTEDCAKAEEIFTDDYAYFSSYSTTWLKHARRYVAKVVDRFQLGRESLVVELAANDGYLLQYVAERRIPCIGVEPTARTAASAREKGLHIVESFFSASLAEELLEKHGEANLIVANNVLAHVPDINDFVSGVALLLKDDGIATFEFPHLLNLVAHNQFDTIYHEHFSYLSLSTVVRIFASHGLCAFDVEEISTHGGSLRVYVQLNRGPQESSGAVELLLQRERSAGLTTCAYYAGFQSRVEKTKREFLGFLFDSNRNGKKVIAYGAAAKGNTLMNYSGVRSDLIPYVVDKCPAKQGKFLPGSRIPVVCEDRVRQEHPDHILILPWNIRDEVMAELAYVRDWGGNFVTAIPELRIA